MTSAHRPTWAPAKGHDDQGGARLFGGTAMASARNQTAHRRMKVRAAAGAPPGEGGPEARRRQREELAAREAEHFRKAGGGGGVAPPGAGARGAAGGAAGAEVLPLGPAPDPALAPSGRLEVWAEDADVELSGSSSGGEDSDSEEDEEAALMAELARIKEERAAEAREAEAAEREAAEAEKEEEVRRGNPLLGGGDATLKRRWDDDVVFRNQTRTEPKKPRRFVNDTVRSDFHRRFLTKYIQ